MQCVKAPLWEVGATLARGVCKLGTYVTDASYRDLVYSEIFRHLDGIYPASTGLVVSALVKPEMKLEIDVYVVVPEGRDRAVRRGH